MKRILFVFALIFTTLVANAQKFQTPEQCEKLEAKHGIRDIKLNTHISEYPDLYRTDTTDGCGAYYERKNENLFFGDVKANYISYWYANYCLVNFQIGFDNDADYSKILNSLRELYGEPEISHDKQGNVHNEGQLIWKAKSFYITANPLEDAGRRMNFRMYEIHCY